MRTIILLLSLLISSLLLFSCKKDNPIPPEEQPQINLTLEDVSCTEAWIKISTVNISLPVNIELLKDSNLVQTINLTNPDSIVYIDSLLPNKTYSFSSIIQSSNPPAGEAGQSISSASLPVTTLDTTSHNFTFQTWTFGGQAGSCVLYDVAIINENDIWAVGEIYLLDSSGVPDPNAYNAVHWDGSQWELKRINMLSSCNPVTYPPLKAIYAFSDSNIIITSGGSIGWFNGVTNTPDCGIRPLLTSSINKLWGASSNDFYTVGNNGNIAHYLNGQWTRIESGTELNINDIWGYYNEQTQEKIVIAVGGNILEGTENIILQITDEYSLLQLNNAGANYPLSSVWFKSKMELFAAGSGMYRKNYTDTAWRQIPLPNYLIYSMDGNKINDIIICGGVGYIGHFNGLSWINYLENGLTQIPGNYYGCATKGNIMCAVAATIDGKAMVVIGTRN